jgi:hypothetical protein
MRQAEEYFAPRQKQGWKSLKEARPWHAVLAKLVAKLLDKDKKADDNTS